MADDIDEEEDQPYEVTEDNGKGGDDRSGSSDSEDEKDDEVKRSREQLELDEVEALKNDLGDDMRQGKRIKVAAPNGDLEDQKERVDQAPSKESEDVWKSLQEQKTGTILESEEKPKEEMILVKKQYRFAGEEVKEEKLLPASHPDAIAYLQSLKAKPAAASKDGMSSAPSRRLAAAAGPRKKKSSLAAMSAAATGKPVKINTLEKSKMDWNKFKEQTADEREREEMEAQTKGGSSGLGSMKGYMERKNFLDRVQNRLGEKK